MIVQEEWRPVVGFDGLYEASDQGRIKSVERVVLRSNGAPQTIRRRILRAQAERYGHLHVSLYRSGVRKMCKVHQLVAEAFIGQRPAGYDTRHLNGDPSDNRVDNLTYGTHAENQADMIHHGTSPRGSRCGTAKLGEEDVIEIVRRARGGEPHGGIAERFGVSGPTVCSITTGKSWGWLTGIERRDRGDTGMLGAQNPSSKLEVKQAIEIAWRANSGEHQRSIARSFGVSQATVSAIALGKTWRWCTGIVPRHAAETKDGAE